MFRQYAPALHGKIANAQRPDVTTERSVREHHEREINSMVRCINTVIEMSLKTDKAHGLEGLFYPAPLMWALRL